MLKSQAFGTSCGIQCSWTSDDFFPLSSLRVAARQYLAGGSNSATAGLPWRHSLADLTRCSDYWTLADMHRMTSLTST